MRRLAVVGLLLAISLAGCANRPVDDTMPVPSSTANPSASPSASPSAEPEGAKTEAELVQGRFDTAMAALLATNADPAGRAVIDALVAAGLDKTAMELTPDKTAIGLDADSIQFSVRVGEDCVVGQSGNVGYHSAILPVLDTGKCLVGTTRAITW